MKNPARCFDPYGPYGYHAINLEISSVYFGAVVGGFPIPWHEYVKRG